MERVKHLESHDVIIYRAFSIDDYLSDDCLIGRLGLAALFHGSYLLDVDTEFYQRLCNNQDVIESYIRDRGAEAVLRSRNNSGRLARIHIVPIAYEILPVPQDLDRGIVIHNPILFYTNEMARYWDGCLIHFNGPWDGKSKLFPQPPVSPAKILEPV